MEESLRKPGDPEWERTEFQGLSPRSRCVGDHFGGQGWQLRQWVFPS